MARKIRVKAVQLCIGDVFDGVCVVTDIDVLHTCVIVTYRKASIVDGKPYLARCLRQDDPNTYYIVER